MPITINDQPPIEGKQVVFRNGRLTVDGVDRTPTAQDIRLEIEGDVDSMNLESAQAVVVKGHAGTVSSVSAPIECRGNITTRAKSVSGDIHCPRVGGNARSISGDVKIGEEPDSHPSGGSEQACSGGMYSGVVFSGRGIVSVSQVGSGNSVTIVNGVRVGAEAVATTGPSAKLSAVVAGSVKDLVVNAADNITVHGDVRSASAISGSVYCHGSIGDDVETISGDIVCTELGGTARSMSGEVSLGNRRCQRER